MTGCWNAAAESFQAASAENRQGKKAGLRLTFKCPRSVTHWWNLFQEQNPTCKGAISHLSLLLGCKPVRAETMFTGSPLNHPSHARHSNHLTFNNDKVTVLERGTILSSLCVLTHLILTTNLGCRFRYPSKFTNVQQAQRDEVSCYDHIAENGA